MYNYFRHRREESESRKLHDLRKQFSASHQAKHELNERLARNYKRRIESYVISTLEKPVVINRYSSGLAHCFREISLKKMLGDSNIYLKGFKHESDRIKESIERNLSLDNEPNKHVYNHSFRDRDQPKERTLHKEDMRFKAKTSLERVEEFLKNNTQGELQNAAYKKKAHVNKTEGIESLNLKASEKRIFLAQQIAKKLLPQLHNKTHFNAVTEMYLQPPVGSLSSKARQGLLPPEEPSVEERPEGDEGPSSLLGQSQSFQNFDPVSTSKELLLKCKFDALRSPKAKVLSEGEGHLCSNVNDSIQQIYDSLRIGKSLQKHSRLLPTLKHKSEEETALP